MQDHHGLTATCPWIHFSSQARDRHRLVTAVAFAGSKCAKRAAHVGTAEWHYGDLRLGASEYSSRDCNERHRCVMIARFHPLCKELELPSGWRLHSRPYDAGGTAALEGTDRSH